MYCIAETSIPEIQPGKNNIVVGIVLGCIALTFVCVFGILVALYCSSGTKKPPSDSSHDQFDYAYANDDDESFFPKNSDGVEEHETSFNDGIEYQPPEITPIARNDDRDS